MTENNKKIRGAEDASETTRTGGSRGRGAKNAADRTTQKSGEKPSAEGAKNAKRGVTVKKEAPKKTGKTAKAAKEAKEVKEVKGNQAAKAGNTEQAGQKQKQKKSLLPKMPKAQKPPKQKPQEASGRIELVGRPEAVVEKETNKGKGAKMNMAKGKNAKSKLKIFSLGGLSEIGKNLTVLEYENDIIVIDCGMGFPDDEMPGIDCVIPDITYLEKNADKVRGIFLTHGHEDHIGALPYVLRDLHVPVYGTRLTLGILRNKLSEHSYAIKPSLNCCMPGDKIKVGAFTVEFIHVNHSIADACCFAIKTPVGTVVHSGDFKVDLTPVDGAMIDLPRLGELGREGVLLLMCESTNAERPGYTPSEKNVGSSLEDIYFKNQDRRIIIATFSSNVHRVQQIIDTSVKYKRKVAITGRSMLNVVSAAMELGYMKVPDGVLVDLNEIRKYNPEQLTVITTGSQGEPMSALSRMAFSDHDKIQLGPKDLVVISATPIPGNEKLVGRVINELCKKHIAVIHSGVADVHVSGHACQEEIKMMHALLRPKFVMPIHGEDRHLDAHKALAESMGTPSDHIFISEIGKILEVDAESARFNGTVPSGKVLVDGYGVGDVGNIVLRDRRHLAQDGLIVVVATIDTDERTILSGPDVVSRGFVYVREAEELMEEVRAIASEAIYKCFEENMLDWNHIKGKVKDDMTKYLYAKTKRKPMILPVIMNV